MHKPTICPKCKGITLLGPTYSIEKEHHLIRWDCKVCGYFDMNYYTMVGIPTVSALSIIEVGGLTWSHSSAVPATEQARAEQQTNIRDLIFQHIREQGFPTYYREYDRKLASIEHSTTAAPITKSNIK